MLKKSCASFENTLQWGPVADGMRFHNARTERGTTTQPFSSHVRKDRTLPFVATGKTRRSYDSILLLFYRIQSKMKRTTLTLASSGVLGI